MKLRLAVFALLVGLAAAPALAGDAGSVGIPNFGWTAPSNAGHATTADSATTATTAATATNATHSATADNATNATVAQSALTAQALGGAATVSASQISGLPTCAAGQVLSYSGGAFSCVTAASSNLGVGSCDAALTLIGGKTAKQCCDAGGNVVSAASGSFLCKFSGSSCPSGWSAYLNWTTTTLALGNGFSYPGYGGSHPLGCSNMTQCWTSSHSFSNVAIEQCTYLYADIREDCPLYSNVVYATVSERGCQ